MDNLIFCLNATVPIFAIIVLGRWLRSKNFFTKQTLTDIDRLSFKVLLPILLFRDIAQGRITEQFDPVFFFFCAGATTVYFFAVWIGASLFLKDKSMVGAFTQGAFRGSQAILGVAFVQNLYGDAGLVPLMIVASVPLYNIFSVLVLTVTAPDARTADHHGVVRRTLRGIITNPIILGILAGLPFSLLSIDFPPMADKFLSMLGGCATPMALLSIGAGFEGASAIKKLGPTCAATFIKLILLPVVFLPIAVHMGFREQALVAIVILCGAPSTVSGYVMAKNMVLSGFTAETQALIIGTNLGGLGTLIASMASLISYRQIARELPQGKKQYFGLFTLSNLIFLAILLGVWFLLR